MRELDILAIEHLGIPGLILMENAARAAAEFVFATLVHPARERVLVLCGPGYNGGDGLAIARHLRNAAVDAAVVLAVPRDRYHGDAAANLAIYERIEAPLLRHDEPPDALRAQIAAADVIVDALLGTGADGPPRGRIAELIQWANAAPRARRIAVDIPSGLDADSGLVHEPCLRADATVTFVAEKTGFAGVRAREMLGRVVVVDIGIPQKLIPGRRIA
jgi:NAD(P)H-hydrate epimerase